MNFAVRSLAKISQVRCAGMTLIELVIVVTVVAILMATAVPAYTSYSLRVHRNEAIRLLLQASICQEQLRARTGNYDTSQCIPTSNEYGRYEISYTAPGSRSLSFTATANPQGAQLADDCGSLSLDQSGARRIGAQGISATKCWNGR